MFMMPPGTSKIISDSSVVAVTLTNSNVRPVNTLLTWLSGDTHD